MIKFNKPYLTGKELHYITEAVMSRNLSGDGKYSKLCQGFIEEKFSTMKALLTHSCTASLEMAALLLDIKPGDEVILPSYTFVSTANAFHLRGAELKFVDIRPDTLNIDESKIEEQITKNTKAIVPVHYAGIGCEMDLIMELGNKYNICIVEDAAQGVNAKYKDRYLGTIGDIGCFSFHETKNIVSGEGGATLINNKKFIDRAEIIREKGTNRSKFFRGEVDKYSWVDHGSSYLPSELTAAFLYAQLEDIDHITQKRKNIYDIYLSELSNLSKEGYFQCPQQISKCYNNAHLFYIILESESERRKLIQYLKDRNIHSTFHYLPLHKSPMGVKLGHSKISLPVTEDLSNRLLRLPLHLELNNKDQFLVINSICDYFNNK